MYVYSNYGGSNSMEAAIETDFHTFLLAWSAEKSGISDPLAAAAESVLQLYCLVALADLQQSIEEGIVAVAALEGIVKTLGNY